MGRLITDTSVDEFVRSGSRQSVHVRSPQTAELVTLSVGAPPALG
jgi:hypothetical protein